MCHFWVKNAPTGLIKNLWEKSLTLLPSAYWTLSVCKISQKSLEGIQSYEDRPFFRPNWSICPKQEPFWEKFLISFSSNYWALLLWKVLKDSYNGSRVVRMCHFWTQNEPICPNEVLFFRKILLLSFMPIYIPKTKFRYQSIYDISTIKECWNLISWESFLIITWESCFSQACSFVQNVKGP